MNKKPPAVNPVVLEHKAKLAQMTEAIELENRRLAQSFDFVFDQPKKRNEHQTRVLEHLADCAGVNKNDYEFDAPRDGLKTIAAGIHRDGAQSILKIINRQINNAANLKRKN